MRIDSPSSKKRLLSRWAGGITSIVVIALLLAASYLNWPYYFNKNSVATNPMQDNPSIAIQLATRPRHIQLPSDSEVSARICNICG
jgi:hypothetical protein